MSTLGEAVTPRYYEDAHAAFEAQEFTGTVRDILEEANNAFEEGHRIDFWQPGLLTVGALEYKIEGSTCLQNIPHLVTDTSDLAISMHKGDLTPEALDAYTHMVSGQFAGLLHHTFSQEKDHVTAKSSDPHFSRGAAEALHKQVNNANVLFIVLGQGGITPGIFTYLHYAHLQRSSDSSFYPVRFSRCSNQDEQPQLSLEEADHLQQLAESKDHVVVYDEDVSTGRTLKRAGSFFAALLGRETIPLANRGADPSEITPILGAHALNRTKDLTHT